jgi:L-aspartate oxidase
VTSAADYDVIVVGSGVAGLSCATALAAQRRVLLVTAGELISGSTPWAQGGIAAAIGVDDDPSQHAADTAEAGAGMCDSAIVTLLTQAAPAGLARLTAAGAQFDSGTDGLPALSREGGHRRHRVVHAGGDTTGDEVSRVLAADLIRRNVDVRVQAGVRDLLTVGTSRGRQVCGVALRHADASVEVIRAHAVVLATGGVGGVYRATTNPAEVTGDGLALALRAGASLVDVEFVQFHPTGLRVAGIGQVPLISETLRGAGAVLRDAEGTAIMAGHHPLEDLAPRDIVARRIDAALGTHANATVGLDATALGRDVLRSRFPTAYRICMDHGIDPAREPIPVAPVQHYICGGVRTDAWGATDVTGLFAVGEVAATGVHGANRLASNSLLEGMVFGARVAERLVSELPAAPSGTEELPEQAPRVRATSVAAIRSTMSRYAGVRRDAAGLNAASSALQDMSSSPASGSVDSEPAAEAAANRWTVASALVAAAAARRESRGCHWRSDHPVTRADWQHRVVVRLDGDGVPAAAPDRSLGRSA